MIWVLALLACAGNEPPVRQGGAEGQDPSTTHDTATSDSGGSDSGGSDSGDAELGPCPVDMVLVGAACVDVAEGALEVRDDAGGWLAGSPYEVVDGQEVRAVVALGSVPQAYISGEEAAVACEASGKRLCTSDEWLLACQGTEGRTFPYGDTHDPEACNDSYEGGHPVVDYFGTSEGIWDAEHMNDPGINQQDGTVAVGGAHTDCVTPEGVFDLHGNLHEWVADADGVFRGGFYADAEINGTGCSYRTSAHTASYHDYSTGFRCCADPS